MKSLPLLFTQSQAQPLPNLVIAAWVNSDFILSKDPKSVSIASSKLGSGDPSPPGHMRPQKNL